MKRHMLLYALLALFNTVNCMEQDEKSDKVTPKKILREQADIIIENSNIALIKITEEDTYIGNSVFENILKHRCNTIGTSFENTLSTYNADHQTHGQLKTGSSIKIAVTLKQSIRHGALLWFIFDHVTNHCVGYVMLDMNHYYKKSKSPFIHIIWNKFEHPFNHHQGLSICRALRQFCCDQLSIKKVKISTNNLDNEFVTILTNDKFICCAGKIKIEKAPAPRNNNTLNNRDTIRFECQNCIDYGTLCKDHDKTSEKN